MAGLAPQTQSPPVAKPPAQPLEASASSASVTDVPETTKAVPAPSGAPVSSGSTASGASVASAASAASAAAASTPASATSAAGASASTDANDADDEASADPLPEDPEGIINMEIFSQIQDMDDDDDDDAGGHEFSRGIVWGYFEQAENTFKQMEEAIAEPSLWKLSSLGHFLKGSSAALGIVKVQNSCEKMQHYGNLRDEEVGAALSEDEALKRIKQLLVDCKRDYAVASRWLKSLYGEDE